MWERVRLDLQGRGTLMDSYQIVMKSLRVGRTTLTLAGCIPALVAINGVILAQLLGSEGLAVGLCLVFVCATLGTYVILVDIMSRSAQNLSALRIAGARQASLISALLVGILGFGVAGAAIGTFTGAVLAWGVGRVVGATLLSDVLLVIAASAGAITAGTYVGVGATWKR